MTSNPESINPKLDYEAVRLFLLINPSYTPDLSPVAGPHELRGHALGEAAVVDAVLKGASVTKYFLAVAHLKKGHRLRDYYHGPDGDFVPLSDVPHADDLGELPADVKEIAHHVSLRVYPTVGYSVAGDPERTRYGLYREFNHEPWALARFVDRDWKPGTLPAFAVEERYGWIALASVDSAWLYATRTPAVDAAIRDGSLMAIVARDHVLVAVDLRNDCTTQRNEAVWSPSDDAYMLTPVVHGTGRARRIDQVLWARPGRGSYWSAGDRHLTATRRGNVFEVNHV